jgi:hypothetical protein
MKKLLIVALILAASTTALAQQRRRGGRRPRDYRALSSSLSGGYALVTRLTLTDDQKKVLTEVYSEYSKQYYTASRAVYAKLPKMERSDWSDPVKYAKWSSQRRELMKTQAPKPPVDKVTNVLTAEQLDKVLEAHAVYETWLKWLVEYMAKSEKDLAAAIGVEPEKADPTQERLFRSLARLLDGATLLDRVELTAGQIAELEKLRAAYSAEYSSLNSLLRPATRSDKLTRAQRDTAQSAVWDQAFTELRERHGKKVAEVLTQAQKDKLAKGLELIKARNQDISTKYVAYVKDVDKILPAPKRKAGTAVATPRVEVHRRRD